MAKWLLNTQSTRMQRRSWKKGSRERNVVEALRHSDATVHPKVPDAQWAMGIVLMNENREIEQAEW